GVEIWVRVAPLAGLRRARSFLLLARPAVGPRRSKFLAKILELSPYDAESWCDFGSRRGERRYDAVSLSELHPSSPRPRQRRLPRHSAGAERAPDCRAMVPAACGDAFATA